jgi:dihydroorotate dehydrogenase
MTRLPKSGSIIVNKGLRNDGVDAIIKRLKSRGRISNFIVGVSIARTNDEKSSSLEAGIADYVYSFKRLNEEGIGDYYTINISCPNAFGGEAFTEPELLEKLLSALKTVSCKKPVYVKMPINKSWEDFRNLLDIIIKYGLQGVVIGNLNKDYSYLGAHAEVLDEYAGGLSGKPCEELSNELIRKTRQYFNEMLASEGGANKKRPTIIGVGGIDSVESAKKKFEAGADLIQLITGMIYEGPGLIKKICRGLTSAL